MKIFTLQSGIHFRQFYLMAWLSTAILACGVAGADNAESPAQPAPAKLLSQAELYGEPALQAKVIFEVKRQSLTLLLENLQKETGVVLSQSAEAPVDQFQVTAHIKEMPLGELMCNLSRLFGVSWRKSQDGFIVQDNRETEVEAQLRRLGDLAPVTYKATWRNAEQESGLAALMLPHTNPADLQPNSAGFAVTKLPIELQHMLRQQLRQRLALSLVGMHQQASLAFLEECALQIRPIEPPQKAGNGPEAANPRYEAIVTTPIGDEVVTLPFQLPEKTDAEPNPAAANQ